MSWLFLNCPIGHGTAITRPLYTYVVGYRGLLVQLIIVSFAYTVCIDIGTVKYVYIGMNYDTMI